MIQGLLVLAAFALFGWFCALPALWSGYTKASYWTAGVSLGLGALVAVGALSLPRYSEFWFGNAGGGDGFGIVGFFMFGSIFSGIGLVLLLATAIIAVSRTDRAKDETSD